MAKWTSLFYSGLSEKEDGVMLISIAMMFLVGMSMGWICKKIHLPSLFGMIVTGIVLGPYRRFYFEYFIGSKKDRSYYYFNESGIVIRS